MLENDDRGRFDAGPARNRLTCEPSNGAWKPSRSIVFRRLRAGELGLAQKDARTAPRDEPEGLIRTFQRKEGQVFDDLAVQTAQQKYVGPRQCMSDPAGDQIVVIRLVAPECGRRLL